MKKSVVLIIAIVAIALLLFVWVKNSYNKMVVAEEQVTATWADVETQYQRRADLIPNIVSTVKGYAAHEKETLDAVVTARSRATGITIDPTNMTEANLEGFQAAQDQLSSALSRLLLVREAYPDLKADQQFLELNAQLEGTENRIAVARNRYNDMARSYNVTIRKFPANIFASMFGFSIKPYFASQAGTEVAPVVEF